MFYSTKDREALNNPTEKKAKNRQKSLEMLRIGDIDYRLLVSKSA